MRFVIRKNAQGKYWWRIVSDGNNKILAASELLEDKDTCLHAIAIVKAESYNAPTVDMTHETSVRGAI